MDQGGGSHGGENFESGSTLQIRLRRIADGLDGGGEKKHWVSGDVLSKMEKIVIEKKLWREINNLFWSCYSSDVLRDTSGDVRRQLDIQVWRSKERTAGHVILIHQHTDCI